MWKNTVFSHLSKLGTGGGRVHNVHFWICLPIILLILVGIELPLCVVVTILECCVTFSRVKLSIRSFVLFI